MASEQAYAQKTADMPGDASEPASAGLKHLNEYVLAKMEQLEKDKRDQKRIEEKQRAQAARLSEKAMATVPRAKDMGVNEIGHELDKLNKATFDLKLKSYYDSKNLETSEKRLKQAQDENKTLLGITEEMVLELERKDEAIHEAVALICQLEEKVKSLEHVRFNSISASKTKEQSPSPSLRVLEQPSTKAKSSSPQASNDNLDVPTLRPPSALSQKSSTNTLREIYLERQKFNTSRMSTLSAGTATTDNDKALNEKMSMVSMSSFGGMYDSVRESMSTLKEKQQRMTSITDDEESEPGTPNPAHSFKGQDSLDSTSTKSLAQSTAGGRDGSSTLATERRRGRRERLDADSNIVQGSESRTQQSSDRVIAVPQPDVAPSKSRAQHHKEASYPITAAARKDVPPTQKQTFSERIQSQGVSNSRRMPPPTLTQSSPHQRTLTPKSSHSKAVTPNSSSRDLVSSHAASRQAPTPSATPDLFFAEAASSGTFYSAPTTPSSGPLTSHPFTPPQVSYQSSSTSSLNSHRGIPPPVKTVAYRTQEAYPDSPPVSRGSNSVSNRGGTRVEALNRSNQAFNQSDDSIERYLSESPPLMSDYMSPLKRIRPPKTSIAPTPNPVRRPADVLTPPSTSGTQLRVSDFDNVSERRAARPSRADATLPPAQQQPQSYHHEQFIEPQPQQQQQPSELRRTDSGAPSSTTGDRTYYDDNADGAADAPEHGPGSHPPTRKWGLGGMARRTSVKISQGLGKIGRRRESFGGK